MNSSSSPDVAIHRAASIADRHHIPLTVDATSQFYIDKLWLNNLQLHSQHSTDLKFAPYIGIFLLPGWQLCRRLDGKQWLTAGVGPVAAVVVVVGLFYLDCLMNAMLTSVMPLALGGLASVSLFPAIARATSPRQSLARRPLTVPSF